MITIRYPKNLQTQALDEQIYALMEDSGFEMYEGFEEDYMVEDSTEVVGQFEGSYIAFEAYEALLECLIAICPVTFSDEADR